MTLIFLEDDRTQVVRRVPQGEARREIVLRDLIAERPDILPVHEIDPSYGRLVTVTRELSIPGVGFIDVLLVDQHGRLVVVECKLWRNPQARREVVGQILDYARELSRYGYEDLQRQVAIATRRQGNVLYELAAAAGGMLDEAAFVDRVSRDLAAGRFLLLIVGDGITAGTQRIGEYLRDQPGLAFGFGLIEMAEYRYSGRDETEHVVIQPRVLAQTALIERYVIRNEVAGVAIDTVEPAQRGATAGPRAVSDNIQRWRAFADRAIADMRFDDPGQPHPRVGGNNWLRVPLPDGLYVNLYRSTGTASIGAQVRFAGAEPREAYDALLAERLEIDAELAQADIGSIEWADGEVPVISLTTVSPQPWTEPVEELQRAWMSRVANALVNSLRPRLQRLERDLAA